MKATSVSIVPALLLITLSHASMAQPGGYYYDAPAYIPPPANNAANGYRPHPQLPVQRERRWSPWRDGFDRDQRMMPWNSNYWDGRDRWGNRSDWGPFYGFVDGTGAGHLEFNISAEFDFDTDADMDYNGNSRNNAGFYHDPYWSQGQVYGDYPPSYPPAYGYPAPR